MNLSVKKESTDIFEFNGRELKYFQSSFSEQIEKHFKDKERVYFQVSTLAEASEVCQRYIEHFNLGSSSWTGGRVINDESDFIANISYNGRIWNSEDYKNAEEIVISR